MKKSLIITASAIALLAVSCGKGSASPKKDSGFKFTEAEAFYAERDVQNVKLGSYKAADKNASFEYSEDFLESDDIYEARIYESDHDEMTVYARSLEKLGWTMELNSAGDFEGAFGDTLARIEVADWTLEGYPDPSNTYDCIRIFFSVAEPPSPVWPQEAIEELFDTYGADYYEFPALVAENAEFVLNVYSQSGYFADGALVTVTGATDNELNTFINTTLVQAGWEITGTVASGRATKTITELAGIANVVWQQDTGVFYIALLFELTVIPSQSFPSDEIAAVFARLGLPAFSIPGPDGEGYTYEFNIDESNINYIDNQAWCYDYMYINNMSKTQFDAYIAKLVADGWTGDTTKASIELSKHFDDIKATAKIMLRHTESADYGDYGYLRIYYVTTPDPAAEWPTDEVAEMVGDFEDVLPAYGGTPEGTFTIYNDSYGRGVLVFVGEDNIDAGITAYKATLVEAGFILNEESGKYLSPSSEYYVEVYEGTDGAFGIEITNAPSKAFPVAKVNAFLTAYELGFSILDTTFAANEDGYSYSEGVSSNYHYCKIEVNGNHLSEFVSALESILLDAGYELDDDYSDENNSIYFNEVYHEVDIVYNSTSGITRITFWE